MDFDNIETEIDSLGPSKIASPITRESGIRPEVFIRDARRILLDVSAERLERRLQGNHLPLSLEMAGPREKIYFDPSKVRCALVTCGGLCPGLNDIIRAIVLELFYRYGVRNIYGIRYGLQGFVPEYGHDLMELSPQKVVHIMDMGGSILGSSRGPQDLEVIVDSLERMNIGVLFMIGGDGTLMAASRIAGVITQRGLKISVIGIPKTIDNDIYLVSRSFGFDTAVEIATQAIKGAHNEAQAYPNGVGLIKLMGRYSGFIAATAALAQQDVNFVLIPEVEFDLDGPGGFLAALEARLGSRGHAVVIVAEGAGQHFFADDRTEHDASGNVRLKDIGLFLKEQITAHFKSQDVEIAVKYIDPSYMIRSLPANANDSVFCGFLGRDAVHAAMAGKTRLIIGHWNNHFVHVPMSSSAGRRKQVLPSGKLWQTVLESTGQGSLKNNPDGGGKLKAESSKLKGKEF